ncbi:MAG TPA: ATP-binding protein, partial [Chitinophagaceae bacterium]|nr:ATP-binding protein [Chitinophagaceae bacterium]
QYVVDLVHEIRNPLTNIQLSVGMLELAMKENDLKIYLDIIMRSSIRIHGLINELLKYQQPGEMQAGKHSIHRLLDEVLEMIEDRRLLKNITVRKDYAIQDCKIVLNRPKIKIALTNIIINAIEAMTPEKGELKLVTKSIADKYVIEIEDNGCGISRGNLKYIFKPYFTNKPGGLGLGLKTTYDILRSNHVRVNVESKEGKGTRFILFFDIKHQE